VRDLNKKGLRILVIQESHRLEVAATLNSATSVPDRGLDRVGDARVLLVEEATNGEEAVRVASEQHPQIILMDLSLPLIDGLAATRRIRSLPGLDKVPIIAVSAHDTADFHSEALAAGCNAYITKPIDYPELEEIVSRLLPTDH
jgi:CheY-like chemotaxis protein